MIWATLLIMIYQKTAKRPPYWKNWWKGLKGEAISFVSKNEVGLLKAIQRHTGLDIKVLKFEPVKADSKFQKVVAVSTNKDETAFEQKPKH